MANISFFGAAGTVTGSCFLFETEGKKILVDMGMFQGTQEIAAMNYWPLPFSPENIDAVLLTHAHLDHCGRIPLLSKKGFSGPIYMTKATYELMKLTLYDAAKIARDNRYEREPLYAEDDVDETVNLSRTKAYHETFDVEGFKVTFLDAGHILGSAIILIEAEGKTFVFSGDLGNSPEDLVRPTDHVSAGNTIVMETTYGDHVHSKDDPAEILKEEILAIEKTSSTLLIPSFSLERTQEILHLIDHLKQDEDINPTTRVYLDSPMAIAATRIYKQFRELYNTELSEHANRDDPFHFPELYLIERARDSQKIKEFNGPKVIIAGSGMMTGGRILHHSIEFLPQEDTHLLFVGYQAEETLGRQILTGDKEVVINGRVVPIRAVIRKSSAMSAHADSEQLLKWLGEIKGVETVHLVHGENGVRKIFAEKVITELGITDVRFPDYGNPDSPTPAGVRDD